MGFIVITCTNTGFLQSKIFVYCFSLQQQWKQGTSQNKWTESFRMQHPLLSLQYCQENFNRFAYCLCSCTHRTSRKHITLINLKHNYYTVFTCYCNLLKGSILSEQRLQSWTIIFQKMCVSVVFKESFVGEGTRRYVVRYMPNH